VELAKQTHGSGTTRVFLVTEVDQPNVLACYAWCMAGVAIADRPERLLRGARPLPPTDCLAGPPGGGSTPSRTGLVAALLLLLKDIRRTLGR
jgi:hypothetical protein